MIAIVGGAHVENALQVLLISRFISLHKDDNNLLFDNGGNGTLANFSSKTMVAYAFGLIGQKTREDLDTIRHIRNTFAHALVHIQFTHEDISPACMALHHKSQQTMSLFLKGPKAHYVRAILNISACMRGSIESLGLLPRQFLPHPSLP